MNKYILFLMLVACFLVSSSCSRSVPNRSSYSTFTAANEAELRDGSNRVNSFKQELENRGFRTISMSHSNLWEQVGLKGDYGELKGVEITLKIGKELAMTEPHLGANLQAEIGSKAAEQEFEKLDGRIKSVVQGK